MKIRSSALLIITLILSPLLPVFGQASGNSAQQDEQRVRIGTAEVALDVVVRDKKGRPVRDLTAADFEIYEDGVRQQIESFRLVLREAKGIKREEAEAKSTTPANLLRNSAASSGVVALVFDRLSPDARALARKAAMAYTDELIGSDFTGIFLIDLSLHILQPYTDNPQLVKQAVDRATSTSISTFASNTEQTRSLSSRSGALEREGATSEATARVAGAGGDSAAAGAAGSAAGIAGMEQSLAQINQRMLETFEMLERDQQGYATINGLLAVLSSMRNLPGRKTVIFFSEGLSLPPAVQTKFDSVISAANRANVSVYPIDSAGLRIESANAETIRELNALAERRMRQVHRGRDDASGPMMKSLERNEDLLRLSPHSGLGLLADQTGGFLIRETNDLSAGLRRIDEDMRFHYMLTYVPKNQEYDGRFRQITVKVNHPNLEVQTRKGYYAIDSANTAPVLDYEVAALAALGRAHSTSSFAFRVLGLNFPESNRLGLVPVLAEAPMNAFTFEANKEKRTYQTDFSIVALIKNESKQVIHKLSQHYLLSGPMDRLEAAKRDEVIFYREVELPPGRYTIEAIAYDAPTGKASVRTTNIEVTGSDEAKLRLSSIVILKRADRLTAADQKRNNPFHFGEVLVYPNLGESLRKSTAKQIAFFFTAYPAKNATADPKLTIEVRQNGRPIGQTSAELPSADAAGRIQYASALPLDNFSPGVYELRITVKDEHSSVSRSTQFTVEP